MPGKQSFENIHLGLGGRFAMVVTGPDGKRRSSTEFNNLILNQGLDRLCGTAELNILSSCQVGAGSAAVLPGQRSLVSRIAGDGSPVRVGPIISSGGQRYTEWRTTWRFNNGAAAGNIAEVGVGWATSGDVLFSRALVRDANGQPTTVTVLSDETLEVTYVLRVYFSTEDSLSTLNIDGVSHSVAVRPSRVDTPSAYGTPNAAVHYQASVTAYNGPMGLITESPSGSFANASPTKTLVQYSPGSFVAEASVRIPLTSGNLSGGIRSLSWSGGGGGIPTFQMQFDPAIPKTASQIFTFNMRVTMGRADVT